MKNEFGKYIRKLRTENNLTLTQLAAKLELDSANLSKIETGKRQFNKKKLALLAECFDLDIDKLKEEYYSGILAKMVYEADCSTKAFALAEKKVKYLVDNKK
jgi:transcriptional regulator with XRE-family HTH domain